MGKFLARLKYERLEDFTADEQETEKTLVSVLREINLKLIKFRVIASLRPKIVSTIVCLQRVRDAYIEAMHRFAGRVVQLNSGTNAYSFKIKKVTWSP